MRIAVFLGLIYNFLIHYRMLYVFVNEVGAVRVCVGCKVGRRLVIDLFWHQFFIYMGGCFQDFS